MRYFFHKLGSGNSAVGDYLGDATSGHAREIAIFFGESRIEACRKGEEGPDAKAFCLAGDQEHAPRTRIVIVANREFWVLQPSAPVYEGARVERGVREPALVKLLPVKVLVRKPITEIPHLLASMGSNAYWSRGTFRAIGQTAPQVDGGEAWGSWQHQLAIELQLPPSEQRLRYPRETKGDVFRFLSSVELETVVAKVFEEAGCFVPAYRGGTMADVDILAHNDTARAISIGDRVLPPGTALAIQVKSWMHDPPRVVKDVLSVSLNLHPKDRGQGWDAATLWSVLSSAPKTRAWLARSLDWLPVALRRGLSE